MFIYHHFVNKINKFIILISNQRIIKAFGYSLIGIKSAFKSEPAFQQEILLSILFIPIALFLNVSPITKVVLISSIFFILIAELINTAIETIIDRISMEQNHLSKKAKDLGSAIVFISIINAVVSWIVLI